MWFWVQKFNLNKIDPLEFRRENSCLQIFILEFSDNSRDFGTVCKPSRQKGPIFQIGYNQLFYIHHWSFSETAFTFHGKENPARMETHFFPFLVFSWVQIYGVLLCITFCGKISSFYFPGWLGRSKSCISWRLRLILAAHYLRCSRNATKIAKLFAHFLVTLIMPQWKGTTQQFQRYILLSFDYNLAKIHTSENNVPTQIDRDNSHLFRKIRSCSLQILWKEKLFCFKKSLLDFGTTPALNE